jgi:hypothetical protein
MRASLLLALVSCASALGAQRASSPRVLVLDDRGAPVPYAVVMVGGSNPRVTNDSGMVQVGSSRRSELDLWVRRVGYREHRGEVAADSATGTFRVTLQPIARALGAVVVEERLATPLSRTGFYDRIDRVQRGAIVGEFITPEELDARNASKVSDMMRGRRLAHLTYVGSMRQPVILGRGGCVMTILLDGSRLNNTAQDVMEEEGPTSISNLSRAQRSIKERDDLLMRNPSIDELVSGREVNAIEIYSSMATAPAELVQLSGGGGCGVVAIWTGPRQ